MNVSPNSSPTFDRQQSTTSETERFADERAQKQAKITESSADRLKGPTEEEKTNSARLDLRGFSPLQSAYKGFNQLTEAHLGLLKGLGYIQDQGKITFVDSEDLYGRESDGLNGTAECEFPGEFQDGKLNFSPTETAWIDIARH